MKPYRNVGYIGPFIPAGGNPREFCHVDPGVLQEIEVLLVKLLADKADDPWLDSPDHPTDRLRGEPLVKVPLVILRPPKKWDSPIYKSA